MDEKLRPGHEVMQQHTQTLVGVTPNPASTLAWPMSYSPNVSSSYERSPISNVPGPDGAAAGTRYDPIRQDHGEQYNVVQEKQIKRSRLDDSDPNAENQEESNFNYSYEPQKIVTPTNSLQSGKRSHVCDICGATFTRQHNLKSHFLTHTSSKKEFICSECGSEFRRSHDLKRHQKLHTGEKPFACLTCGRRFARADALGRHTKSTGDVGCVNSRKATSDNGSAGDGQSSLISPIDTSKSETRRDSATMLSGSRSSPDVESQHFSIPDRNDINSHAMHANQFAQNEVPSESGTGQGRAALPPLRASFPFDHSQSFAESSNTREILASPPFGLPAGFESRSSSAHPLSFDRGSVQDASQNQAAQANSAQPMVPLQRYRQLEAEHSAAMERIRNFEGDKETTR